MPGQNTYSQDKKRTNWQVRKNDLALPIAHIHVRSISAPHQRQSRPSKSSPFLSGVDTQPVPRDPCRARDHRRERERERIFDCLTDSYNHRIRKQHSVIPALCIDNYLARTSSNQQQLQAIKWGGKQSLSIIKALDGWHDEFTLHCLHHATLIIAAAYICMHACSYSSSSRPFLSSFHLVQHQKKKDYFL